jgi:alpha-methylacyl-CoA racemase
MLDQLARGKRSVGVDLKNPQGVETVLRLIEKADVLLEPFRPGVMEKLGLGPEVACKRNSRLVYARLTGYGQTGPYANMAGHDINYIAISGMLSTIGRRGENPVAPINLLGDFAGGGMLCALGIALALLERGQSGRGQVVDAAMVDGSALLTTAMHGHIAEGWWATRREDNLLDGGAPFYAVYETGDGGHVAVGALEPQFFAALLEGLGIDPESLPAQGDREGWPVIRAALAERFASQSRDRWAEHFASMDACVSPVLDAIEAKDHPHNRARNVFVDVDGLAQPAPGPRFEATPLPVPAGPGYPGRDTDLVLKTLGYSGTEVSMLRQVGAVA